MTKTVRAILMDPEKRLIGRVHLIDYGQDVAARRKQRCDLIEDGFPGYYVLPNGDMAWHQDVVSLQGRVRCFKAPFHSVALTNKWLITRTEDDGVSDRMVDCKTDINELYRTIEWLD